MASNGTVTITAKVDAARAEEALKSLGAAAQKVSVDIRKASTSQKAAADEATEALRRQSEAAKATASSFDLGAASLGRMAGAFGVGATAAQIFGEAMAKVREGLRFATEQAALYESSMKSLQTITVRTGGNVADATALVKQFSDAISSPAAAAQAVRTFTTMNLSMEQQTKLITGIRDGIASLGGDVNEQLPLMALAIKRQESALLDNMGVTRTIEAMYKDYAKSIGSTVDQLTQQQKEQAVVNGVLKDLEPLAGQAKESLDTYKGSVSNLNSALLELGTTAGDKINPHLKLINNQMAETARRLNSLVSDPINANFPAEPKAKGDLGLPAGFKPTYSLPGGLKLRTKQEQEEFNLQQAEAARTEAAEAKKRAEERAKDQARQAQELRDTLATIGKTGRDLELAQEAIYHRKQMELAQGNHRNLELEAERHRRALQVINSKSPALVVGGVNTGAPGLSLSMSGGAGKLNMGSLGLGNWSASGGQALSAANPGNPGAEWYASIKTATETGLFDAVKAAASTDFGGLGSALTSIMAKAPDPMIQAMVGPAGLAVTFGSMIIDSFARAAERADQVKKHIRDLDPTPLSKDEKRAREVADDGVRNDLIRQQNAEKALLQQLTLNGAPKGTIDNVQRSIDARQLEIIAIDRARQSAWNSADAAEILAEKHKKLSDAADQASERFKNSFRAEQDSKGRARSSYEDYLIGTGKTTRQALDLTKADSDLTTRMERLNTLITGSGGKALTLEDLKNHPDGSGLLAGVNSKGLLAAGLQNEADGSALLYDALDALFRKLGIEADKDRVGPGSTPDRPLYSSIVNFKDMRAFFAPGELFRASGPGTRRDDGMKGRAVNTRGA